MADFPAPNAGAAAGAPPISAALLAYALFGAAAVVALVSSGFPVAAPLMGIVGIVGLIVAYVKRDDAQGTWVASHFSWLIRTFWYSLLWGAIGAVFAITIVGLHRRDPDLGGRLDLGDLPGDPRLSAVQGKQADTRQVTRLRGAGRRREWAIGGPILRLATASQRGGRHDAPFW